MNSLRRLSYVALAIAYLQIVFGAIVRIMGSGYGCGEHWPKCADFWFPPPFSIYFITDPKYLLGSMVGVGIAWASILAMPYAILTGSLPPSKLGYYMGVFNVFIVIPQIVAAALLGFIVKHFFGARPSTRS